MIHRLLLVIWLFLASITITYAGWRDHDDSADWEPPEDRNGYHDLDGVVSDLRRRRQGRVLSTDTYEEDGRPVHRIRILNENGRVRPLHFDGETGRPLPRHRDRNRYSYP